MYIICTYILYEIQSTQEKRPLDEPNEMVEAEM